MRRIATASNVLLLASAGILLGTAACTDTLTGPASLQEELAPPAAVRSADIIGVISEPWIISPPTLNATLEPGGAVTVGVTVWVPALTTINVLTLEVCTESYAGWLHSVDPLVRSVPFPAPISLPMEFSIVVGPPSGAELNTHSFDICAVADDLEAARLNVTIAAVDLTAPVITLLGSDPVELEAGGSYTDAGATAWDNIDGDITGSIITDNPVDTEVPGTYTVTYNVSDAAGNPAVQVTRTVVVNAPTTTTIEATIDIKPGSDRNSINLGSKGKGKAANSNAKIPVALFSTEDFDATLVDVSTVRLGDEDLEVDDAPVVLKKNGNYQAGAEDVDGDGLMDMVFHFPRATLIDNGDLTEASEYLWLTGIYVDGRDIIGVDAVRVIY